MSNILKLKTWRDELDWSYEYEVEIDIDEYVGFTVDFRLGTWHLIGHKCSDDYKWTDHELSYHWVFFSDMVDFIVKVNAVKDKYGLTRCRVFKFNNFHYSNDYYKHLARLLEEVEKKQEKLNEQK